MNAIYVYYTIHVYNDFMISDGKHETYSAWKNRKEKWSKYKVSNDGRKRKTEKKMFNREKEE